MLHSWEHSHLGLTYRAPLCFFPSSITGNCHIWNVFSCDFSVTHPQSIHKSVKDYQIISWYFLGLVNYTEPQNVLPSIDQYYPMFSSSLAISQLAIFCFQDKALTLRIFPAHYQFVLVNDAVERVGEAWVSRVSEGKWRRHWGAVSLPLKPPLNDQLSHPWSCNKQL